MLPLIIRIFATTEINFVITLLIGLLTIKQKRVYKKIKIKIKYLLSVGLESMVVGLLELEKVFRLPKIF
jgi:hypothetical protein